MRRWNMGIRFWELIKRVLFHATTQRMRNAAADTR